MSAHAALSTLLPVAPSLLVAQQHAAAESFDTTFSYMPVIGSSVIMLTIVGLLFVWEKSVEWVRENVSAALLPVVESILAEMGGLGFIGLVLQTSLGGANREFLEALSVKFFGEADILVETFEFLHTSFFQVGIGFFIAAGAMVAVGLRKLAEIETIQELRPDAMGACTVSADKLAAYLPVVDDNELLYLQTKANPIPLLWSEIMMPTEERAGKVLLMRDDLMRRFNLPNTFRIETFVECAFAKNLLETVELSPLTWVYLIPALALANSVDLSHEVVNAASPNAAESAGYFFSTPWAIGPSVFTVLLSLIWGYWNCYKTTYIKYMLMPRLGRDEGTGAAKVFPPPVEFEHCRQNFNSSPPWVQPIEKVWAKPARNDYDSLFGTAGAAGPALYRNSIKFHTWLCITNVVFFGSQIVSRDVDAVLTGTVVGDPSHLIPELVAYGSFVLLTLVQLIFVAPRAFWNFCIVSSVEERESAELLEAQYITP